MKEDQFENLVQCIKDNLAESRKELLEKIQYYGDKGPNMPWLNEREPSKNAAFIDWIQAQWKICFARLDEVNGFVRPPQDAHLAEDAFARIRQMLEQEQKNALGELLPQFTALAANLERNLAEEIRAFRQEVNDQKAKADAALNMEVNHLQGSVNSLNKELTAEKRIMTLRRTNS